MIEQERIEDRADDPSIEPAKSPAGLQSASPADPARKDADPRSIHENHMKVAGTIMRDHRNVLRVLAQ